VSAAELTPQIRTLVEERLPGCTCVVAGGAGHYTIDVVSERFAGLSTLERHRLVLGALTSLMGGDDAPLHAVDKLTTRLP
jgi:stress-induced morphogen